MPPILSSLPVARVKFIRTLNNQSVSPTTVTATPTAPYLTVAGQHGYVDLAPVTSQIDQSNPTVAFLDLVVTDDPDVAETFGWTIVFSGSTRPARVVSVPQSGVGVTTITVNGQQMPSVWLDTLADFTGASGPTGPSIATFSYVNTAFDEHEAAADPHPGYLLEGQSTTPTGGAGGVLSGTYPNPGFAVDMATQAELDTAVGTRASKSANLSDLSSIATARTNLGVAGRLTPLPTIDAFNPPAGLTALVGDNTTNDRPALQAALDYVKTTYGGGRVVVSKPNTTGVKCLTGITIPTKVQLWSDEATLLNFSGIPDGTTAITVNDQDFTPLVGVKMDGGNFTPAANPTNATVGLSVTGVNLNFEKLAMQYFGKHLALARNSTFLLLFSDCRLGRAGTIVDLDIEGAGVSNAGERVVFRGCVLANSNRAFHATANGAHLRFEDCSIDFCTEFGRINNAQVSFRGHLECSSSTPHLFDITGNSRLFLSDTVMVLGQTKVSKAVGPANYGFGSVRMKNVSCFYTDSGGTARNRLSEDLIPWESGITTKTLAYPWPLKWLPVTADFCSTDGAVVPNDDRVRVTAMDTAAGTITLTSTAAFAGQRWVRVSFG